MASRSAIDNFPPVPALSDRQIGVEILLCIKVDPKEYASFTFSPKFKEIYGEPTQYYSDFYRLMTTPFDQNLLPKFRMSFLKFATTINLLDFYTQVDQIALGRSLPVLGRREMEAGWTQYFTMRYAADAEKDIPVLIKEKDSVHTKDGARNYLQVLLRKGIGQIFDSNPKVEAYWEKKRVKYASLQLEIERFSQGHDEPREEMVLPEGDEDHDMGEDEPVDQLAEKLDDLEMDDDEYPDMTPAEAMARLKALRMYK